jgi:hypothetical protein
VPDLVRKHAVAYAVLLVLFCLVMSYQVRSSLDTVHLERHLDFWVPFVIAPFTSRIANRDYFQSWEQGTPPRPDRGSVVHIRDEVLAVNGRPFRGVSTYLRELRKAENQPNPLPEDFQWHPFVLTLRSPDSRVRQVEILFPHCTCGVLAVWEATGLWVIPPLFCVLLGFTTVCLRPRSIAAWAFLGLMLSLSQLRFWPEWYTGFQQTSNPMAWSGWGRIPAIGYKSFVQQAWPAALIIAATHVNLPRPIVRRFSILLAGGFVVFALAQATLQIAWSEDYWGLVPIYQLLRRYQTEMMLVAIAAIGILAWIWSPKFGLPVTLAGLAAAAALYARPAAITAGKWNDYSDNTRRFDASIPAFHLAPEWIALLFTAACAIAALAAFRRAMTLRDTAGVILCAPFTLQVARALGGYGFPSDPWPFMFGWPWIVLALAAMGLSSLAWSLLRRTRVVAE